MTAKRRPKVFLSVDLDFWNDANAFPKETLDELARLKVPKSIVIDHHHMLRYVNAMDWDELVNVDEHSDLMDKPTRFSGEPVTLHCGSWVNYVNNRGFRTYVWSHPSGGSSWALGSCHRERIPFGANSLQVCGWQRATHRACFWPDLKNVVGVSIAVSPDYSHKELLCAFAPWAHDNKDKFVMTGRALQKVTKAARAHRTCTSPKRCIVLNIDAENVYR